MSFGLVEGNRRRYDEANAENIDSSAPDRFDHSKPGYLSHAPGEVLIFVSRGWAVYLCLVRRWSFILTRQR